jgi:Flp pilus assembly protein TadD
LFSHALEVTDDNYVAHNGLGAALARGDKHKEAVFHYKEAIRIKPDSPDAHGNLGLSLLKLWRFEEAEESFRQELKIGRREYMPKWHRGLATTLIRMGDMEGGISHYREALKVDVNDAESHNNLAIALMRVGKKDEAIEHFEHAMRLRPLELKYRNNFNKAKLSQQKKL